MNESIPAALEQFYDAINRNDINAATSRFDPEIVRVEPEGFPTAGTYRGIPQVAAHLEHGRGTWAEGSCQLEKVFVNGEKAVAFLYAWVRMKGASEWTGGRFADAFAFHDGKMVEYHSFGDRGDALKWAGIEDKAVSP